jgi:hypothetical protein
MVAFKYVLMIPSSSMGSNHLLNNGKYGDLDAKYYADRANLPEYDKTVIPS